MLQPDSRLVNGMEKIMDENVQSIISTRPFSTPLLFQMMLKQIFGQAKFWSCGFKTKLFQRFLFGCCDWSSKLVPPDPPPHFQEFLHDRETSVTWDGCWVEGSVFGLLQWFWWFFGWRQGLERRLKLECEQIMTIDLWGTSLAMIFSAECHEFSCEDAAKSWQQATFLRDNSSRICEKGCLAGCHFFCISFCLWAIHEEEITVGLVW